MTTPFDAMLEEFRSKVAADESRQFRVVRMRASIVASASIAEAMVRFWDGRRTLVTGLVPIMAVELSKALQAREVEVPVASHGTATVGQFWAGILPILCATWEELESYAAPLPNVAHWHIYSRVIPSNNVFRRQFGSMLRIDDSVSAYSGMPNDARDYVHLYLHSFP